jgi:hypothetical protein
LPDGTYETMNGCDVCGRGTTWRQPPGGQWFCTRCGTREEEQQQEDATPADTARDERYRRVGLTGSTPRNRVVYVSERKKGPGLLFFLVAAVVIIVVIAAYEGSQQQANDKAAAAKYAVVITGSMPKIQTVGLPVSLSFTVQNIGAAIPDYAILFNGIGAWVVDDISASGDPNPQAVGPNHGYAFGPLAANATMTINMDMVPKDTGYQTLSTISYPNVGSDNLVAADTPIDNGGGVQWAVTVNP